MTKSTLAAVALAVAAMIGGTTASAPSAEAGYKVRSFGIYHVRPVHFVRPVHYIRPVHYVRPVVYHSNDCGHAYAAWKSTGSYHWKSKYFACKGW